MLTANVATLIGIGVLSAVSIAVYFSPYRRWLGFMLAGMAAWGLVECMRFAAQSLFELPMSYSYLSALTILMLMMTIILVLEDRRMERVTAKRRYIEHTPVYEEDHQHVSSR